jgi:hypothetical protein
MVPDLHFCSSVMSPTSWNLIYDSSLLEWRATLNTSNRYNDCSVPSLLVELGVIPVSGKA